MTRHGCDQLVTGAILVGVCLAGPWWPANLRAAENADPATDTTRQLETGLLPAALLTDLPLLPTRTSAAKADWLLDGTSFQAGVYRLPGRDEIALDNGLVRRTFRVAPNAATIALDNLMTDESILRGVKPEARLTINGKEYAVGGLAGQPDYAYLLPEWVAQLRADPDALRFVGWAVGEPTERFPWKRVRHHAPTVVWPPPGIALRMDYVLPAKRALSSGTPLPADTDRTVPTASVLAEGEQPAAAAGDVRVSVHYELYDGLPVMCKWLTVHNGTQQTITVDRFSSELLAVVEQYNWVEQRDGVPLPHPNQMHVETDMAFGGFQPANTSHHTVHWRPDPQFQTQVNYQREMPCLLVVAPTYGPAQDVAPKATFDTFRTFELVHDTTDRERRGLALRRMYRTIAPWVTENPLMMHMRTARPEAVKAGIDQCAEVGFEMMILSFGSGFNIENDSPEYLDQCRALSEYARAKGVEIGGYSLLASRRVGGGNDVVSPPGTSPTFGNCPALTSTWGQEYFGKLYAFFPRTGFSLLEHDGSYPGDVDVTPRPPLQKGLADSQWAQWRVISDFYKWCRAQGIYLNVPDYYYLVGSNKCGMGYRETNWSLPRAQQVIHTRQNIYDGTWTKTPSMGWMFVPLTEYHGGGPAATIEPLDQHRDHYARMLTSNLALGVQACYRGPRLFDSERTRDLVRDQVAWYKQYRDILESDVVHGRRADGRDLDWMLHVNPALEHKGMLVVFNPLPEPVRKTLRVNLYYTGLTDQAVIRRCDTEARTVTLNRDYSADITVSIEGHGFAWYVVQ